MATRAFIWPREVKSVPENRQKRGGGERDTNDTNDVLLRETKKAVMSISDTSTRTK